MIWTKEGEQVKAILSNLMWLDIDISGCRRESSRLLTRAQQPCFLRNLPLLALYRDQQLSQSQLLLGFGMAPRYNVQFKLLRVTKYSDNAYCSVGL